MKMYDHFVTTCCFCWLFDEYLVTTWWPLGDHLVTIWCILVDYLVTTLWWFGDYFISFSSVLYQFFALIIWWFRWHNCTILLFFAPESICSIKRIFLLFELVDTFVNFVIETDATSTAWAEARWCEGWHHAWRVTQSILPNPLNVSNSNYLICHQSVYS